MDEKLASLFSQVPPKPEYNPVRKATLELDIRSFTVRGKLFEEDIVTGRADAIRVIFVGLFGRPPEESEARQLRQFIAQSLFAGLERAKDKTQEFMKTFPDAPPDVAIQHWASFRKASRKIGQINSMRPPAELLAEMIEIHMENVAVAALAALLRRGNYQANS